MYEVDGTTGSPMYWAKRMINSLNNKLGPENDKFFKQQMGGNKSFKLERCSGKKSYILSARELSITWANNPLYWSWIPTTESRFSEAAVLIASNWLEIRCEISSKMLTPSTTYGAFIIFRKTGQTYGLVLLPAETSVEMRNQTRRSMADLSGGKAQLSTRPDGWTEAEIGEFFTGEDDAKVRLSLTEVKGYHLKGGLVVEGMEFRPKPSSTVSSVGISQL